MIRVGAVNIDTSHPMGFAQVMQQDNRARYVAVYNDSFRNDDEVNGFIQRFGLEKRCDTLEELADCCDIGFLHGCNWDDHLRCAKPFLDKGKPVFIDKPICGNLADCNKILQLVQNGAVILGASSARYAFEIQEFLKIPEEERGEIVNVFGTCGVDEFNYGIHIAEAIAGLLGSGAESVRYAGKSSCAKTYSESYFIQFKNGKGALFNTFTGVWQPFVITIMTTKNTYSFKIDSNRLYAALMEQICSRMEGKPNLLVSAAELVESVKIMLAAAASRAQNGTPVLLERLTETMPSYNGAEFAAGYAAAAGAMYAL